MGPVRTFKRKRQTPRPYRSIVKRGSSKKVIRSFKKIKFSRKQRSSNRGRAPVQFGTGHWKSVGHGPRGSSKRNGLIKKMEKLLPPQINVISNGYSGHVTASFQQPLLVSSVYTPFDLYTYNGGTTQVTTQIGQNKVILKDYSSTINFTNQSNALVKVMLYDFIARRDLWQGTIDVANNPLAAWTNEDTVASSYNHVNYGAVPFDSQLLCKAWKCIGSQEYRLSEGETGEHRIHGTMNKAFDMSLLGISANAAAVGNLVAFEGGLKGLTSYCLAVVSGSATDNSNTTVGSSVGKVDFITTNRYVWEEIIGQQQNAITVNNLSTAAGTTYNQGSGADITIANN